MGETPLGAPKLLKVFGDWNEFGTFVVPVLGPGVIGNGLPKPAFIPSRDAARAGSSATPGENPFGHVVLLAAGFVLPAAAESFGLIVGNDPGGGHVGIVSNGELVIAFGIVPAPGLGV